MFTGFTDETFQFFTAIRFNNNTEFFHSNHDWYERSVRNPLKDLAAELGEAVLDVDDSLQTRPEKVISRINRDIRFSRDKSPYRDYMWMSFRRPGTPQGTELSIYFEIGSEGCGCGFGLYNDVRFLMNAMRQDILTDPEGFERAAVPAFERLILNGTPYKRMKIPDGLSPICSAFYPLRGFWMSKDFSDPDLIRSVELVDEVKKCLVCMTPLFRRISKLIPTVQEASEIPAAIRSYNDDF